MVVVVVPDLGRLAVPGDVAPRLARPTTDTHRAADKGSNAARHDDGAQVVEALVLRDDEPRRLARLLGAVDLPPERVADDGREEAASERARRRVGGRVVLDAGRLALLLVLLELAPL